MTASSSFAYIESSLPAGCTLAEYRAGRPRRLSRGRRILGFVKAPWSDGARRR